MNTPGLSGILHRLDTHVGLALGGRDLDRTASHQVAEELPDVLMHVGSRRDFDGCLWALRYCVHSMYIGNQTGLRDRAKFVSPDTPRRPGLCPHGSGRDVSPSRRGSESQLP